MSLENCTKNSVHTFYRGVGRGVYSIPNTILWRWEDKEHKEQDGWVGTKEYMASHVYACVFDCKSAPFHQECHVINLIETDKEL